MSSDTEFSDSSESDEDKQERRRKKRLELAAHAKAEHLRYAMAELASNDMCLLPDGSLPLPQN